MMTMPLPIDVWLKEIDGLKLSQSSALQSEATDNMTVFPIGEGQDADISKGQLNAFLEAAFDEYSRKALAAGKRGLFYAWYDEMSGTVRCSFCGATNSSELPFRRAVNVVDHPQPVSDLAMASPYGEGIPWEELEPAGDVVDGEQALPEEKLTVFARAV